MRRTWTWGGVAALLAIAACGDPVERHIAQLVEGGEGAEEAKIELNLSKKTAIPPLIAAMRNTSYPVRARVDIAQALYRLYLREADETIIEALIEGLQDAETAVRSGAATSDNRSSATAGRFISDVCTGNGKHRGFRQDRDRSRNDSNWSLLNWSNWSQEDLGRLR